MKNLPSFENFINEAKYPVLDGDRKIIGVEWRTGRDNIGFVAVEDSGEFIVYIGVGNGHNEAADISHIADWGSKLPESEGRAFFPQFKNKKYNINL